MNAISEAHDLAQNPLPVMIIDPLTRVWDLDGQISALQEQINGLQRQRTETLEYAVQNRIVEDNKCRLGMKVRKTRSLDIGKFRDTFPEEYMIACDIERKDLESKMEKIGERVPITLVDKLVKKQALEAAPGVVSVTESVSYLVVRK